jgi:hypothetical protein
MPQLGAEQQGRIVPANNRYSNNRFSRSFTIRSSEEQDRSRHHSAHRGGLELSTGAGLCPVRVGRPSVVWLYVWSISGLYLGGVQLTPVRA